MLKAFAAISLGCALAFPALAQPAPAPDAPAPRPLEVQIQTLRFGFLELADDPRLDNDKAYARIQLRALGRAYDGVEVAIAEISGQARATGLNVAAERYQGAGAADLAQTADAWVKDKDIHIFLVDVPGDVMREVAKVLKGRKDLLLINTTAADDDLRATNCQANMLHTIPSYAMLADAMMQTLVSRKWTNIFLLQGTLPDDRKLGAAYERSIKKFGARIVEKKDFVLSNDQRIREANNVTLMTSIRRDYDVVIVIDTDGEFARYVPFNVSKPRPVVGSAGLITDAWHWAWERQGAPQLNSRFERLHKRRMTGYDWGAWVAVRALGQGILRTKSVDWQKVAAHIRSDEMKLDSVKGAVATFRPWDGQLRQPLLAVTDNAEIERLPMRGFAHATNDLDTLGIDKLETQCRM
ncbi:MAG: amino acid ABC transporter substrate-binding protein [Alphaproteobacteria bacterium]|nr:amino acid ABC transporter substrate-binding protein [Alphaproteobacteria bacterium]